MPAVPTNSDSVSNFEPHGVGSFSINGSGDFVTEPDGVIEPRVVPFNSEAVAVANAARRHFYKNLITLQRGQVDLLNG
jgi:hypothetical protein